MKTVCLFMLFAVTPILAALNTPLTVQEALYSGGTKGVNRSSEPFCMGVPIADASGVVSVNGFGLTGASASQFRILGTWPNGHVKWVKVCGVVPSVPAGGTATVTLTDSGTGNSGGADLAMDGGSAITVATGAATFTIKKANFNVVDSVVVGAKTLVAPSADPNRGLLITGPPAAAAFPANVTCGAGTCTAVYSSANDPNSTCSIEENGPVMAVVKCIGNHMDAAGHPYMHYTAREYFYKGKTAIKVSTILRNADYDTSNTPSADCNYSVDRCTGNTFNTSFKGLQAYELRISPNIAGTLNYAIGTEAAAETGTLNQAGGSDSAYIYQGQTQYMVAQYPSSCPFQSACANLLTPDLGYHVAKNGKDLKTGDATKAPAGYADISDASGAGIEIGVYQMAAYFPKSLEFNAGGTDVRIGIFPRQNSQAVYQPWPAWHIDDLYLGFHTASPASLSDEFLKFQHPLLARASVAYYNSTNVFPYPMVDSATEDSYYLSVANTASPTVPLTDLCWKGSTTPCITPDRGVGDTNMIGNALGLSVYRKIAWESSGPLNQEDFRWADMQKFLQRGFTGRWLNSAHFYRFQAEAVWPHSDGTSSSDSTINHFTWRSRPHASVSARPELDGQGMPSFACRGDTPCTKLVNSDKGKLSWGVIDTLHFHWSGMTDYYFLTGDETVREAILPLKDYYLNNDTYQGSKFGGLTISRALGIQMIGSSRMAEMLQTIGDPDADAVLNQGVTMFNTTVKPDPCLSGYPKGCTPPPVNTYGKPDPIGTSRVRGVPVSSRGQGWCPAAFGTNFVRIHQPFENSIEIEGILSLRRVKGPGWEDYNAALDLAYGISQASLLEGYSDDGTAAWQGADARYNGFRYEIPIDFPNICSSTVPSGSGKYTTANGTSIVWDSGVSFDPSWVGYSFGGGYKVVSVEDATHLTVSPSIGVHTSPTAYSINAGVSVIDGKNYYSYSFATAGQGLWQNFYTQYLVNGNTADWERRFKIAMIRATHGRSIWPPDFGSYQIGTLIAAIKNGGNPVLQDVPFTVKDNGSGNYTLSWTVPAGATSYRIKWSPRIIAPSSGLLKFDNMETNTFGLSPDVYSTWFGAKPVTEPSPLAAGQIQSMTIATGGTGLTLANFSVKVYVGGVIVAPQGSLLQVSGNGQSGPAGLPLAAPFVVKVTDANGNAVSGSTVSFAVVSGGGTLSVMQVTTDAKGLASTVLTLGAAAGTNIVTAASGSFNPVTFTATGAASGAAKLVLVSGNNQSGNVGKPLANPLVVKVTNAGGTVVSGVTVNFSITSGSATLGQSQAVSDTQGMASTTVTIGASGAISVSAVSGTLTGSPVIFSATGTAAATTPSGALSWSKVTPFGEIPGVNGYHTIHYDPVSKQTFLYVRHGPFRGTVNATQGSTAITWQGGDQFPATRGLAAGDTLTIGTAIYTIAVAPSATPATELTLTKAYAGPTGTIAYTATPSTIYSTDVYFYNAATKAFTHVGGNGTLTNASTNLVADRPDWPRDRHPVWQMAIDTKRSLLWLQSGVVGGVTPNDMYYMTLNADPTKNTWTRIFPAHLPLNSSSDHAMIYDPDDDVLFEWGYDGGSGGHDHWVYCRTAENPTPGVPTALQKSAGCAVGDDWNEIPSTKITCSGCAGGITQPPGWTFPGLVYDTVTKKAIQYGGGAVGGPQNQIWAFDIPSRTWTRKGLYGTPPPPRATDGSPGQPALAYNSDTHKVHYHLAVGAGSPADYEYDPVADTWTKVASSGGGASTGWGPAMTYDVANKKLITWSEGGIGELWEGTTAVAASNRFDLNSDGVVNVVDVQLAILQVRGAVPCTTADFDGNKACNDADRQLIIAAALAFGK